MTTTEGTTCPSWCTEDGHQREVYRHDQICWGAGHAVVLHLETGAPATHLTLVEALEMDPPRIDPCAYRRWHSLPIVYLHLYRPHENRHLYLDTNLKLTTAEARELANSLVAVADEIDGAR